MWNAPERRALLTRVWPPIFSRATIIPFVDTIEVFFEILPTGLRKRVEGNQRRLRVNPSVREGFKWGSRVTIHRPSPYEVRKLDDVVADARAVGIRAAVSRIDVSFDLIVDERELDDLANELLRCVVLKNAARGFIRPRDGTWYWVMRDVGEGRPDRNSKLYRREGKVLHSECVALELSFFGAEAVHRMGVNRPLDVLAINPHAVFHHNVSLRDFDPQRQINLHIKRNVAKMLERNLAHKRGRKTGKPRYEIDVPARVKGAFERYFLDTAQGYSSMFAPLMRSVPKIPREMIAVPSELDWAT